MKNEDWWSFDTHICAYVADAIEKFAMEGVTDWKSTLPDVDLMEDIAIPLRRYAETKFEVDHFLDNEIYENAKAAFHLFAEHLGHWWD